MAESQALIDKLPQIGQVTWIGLRPGVRQPLRLVERVVADSQSGLVGDRFSGPPGAPRQVTLIQAEHLTAVAAILGRETIDPALLRRNLVVAQINLLALKDREFQIGEAILCGTGNCQPCARMEENLGPGGYNAMRGHGGITAKIVKSGTIQCGDSVKI